MIWLLSSELIRALSKSTLADTAYPVGHPD
jgi:hypothetical protein